MLSWEPLFLFRSLRFVQIWSILVYPSFIWRRCSLGWVDHCFKLRWRLLCVVASNNVTHTVRPLTTMLGIVADSNMTSYFRQLVDPRRLIIPSRLQFFTIKQTNPILSCTPFLVSLFSISHTKQYGRFNDYYFLLLNKALWCFLHCIAIGISLVRSLSSPIVDAA